MTRDELLDRLTRQAAEDERVLALLLGGSLGRGAGDAWSDLDLVAVVSPDDHPGFAAGAQDWIGAAAPVVHGFKPYPSAPLFSAVTADWLRCDLTVTVPGRITGPRADYRPLIDRAQVYDALPAESPPAPPDPARVAALVREFIRILGMAPIGLGRREYAVCITGQGLMRQQLIQLMIEALDLPRPPGALALRPLLPPRDLAALESLPPAAHNRAALLAAQRALAAAFIPRARALLERLGEPWPEDFWAATNRHLAQELGADWKPLD